METSSFHSKKSVKVVGSSGQISLGKEYAGRQVLIEELEPGDWHVRLARVIPENELWLLDPVAKRDLAKAIRWAESYPPQESDPDVLFKVLFKDLEHE